MRKWLAIAVQIPFVAMMFAACSSDDSTTTDAGDSSTKDVVTEKKPLPESGPSDASDTCSPSATIDTSLIKWVPPVTPGNACSADQAQNFYDSCFGTNGTSTACNAFVNNAANAACYSCLVSVSGGPETTYGVLVAYGNIYYPNTAGCIALLTGDSSGTGCGAKLQGVVDCENLACGPNCPAVTSATIQEYDNCTTAAETGVCATYVSAECNLQDAGTDGSAAAYATCESPSGFQAAYNAFVPIFCGGYATDGGTDGGTSDSGSSDAALDADGD